MPLSLNISHLPPSLKSSEEQYQALKSNENLISIKLLSRVNPGIEVEYFVNKDDLKNSKYTGAEGIFVMPCAKIERKNGNILSFTTDKNQITEGIKVCTGLYNEEKNALNQKDNEIFVKLHGGEGGYVLLEGSNEFYAAAVMRKLEDGTTLTEYLAEHPQMTDKEFIELALKVIASLEKVHRANLVHSDVKPDNIIIGKKEAYFIDFGTTEPQGTFRDFPYGSAPSIPQEVFDSIKESNKNTIIYDKKQDFYSLFCWFLEKRPTLNLLGKYQETFQELHRETFPNGHQIKQKNYILDFVKEHNDVENKTPVMKLLCLKPSKLNNNIITAVKMQLHNILLAQKKPEDLRSYFSEKSVLLTQVINNEKNEEVKINARTLLNNYHDEFDSASDQRRIEIIRSITLATIILENPNKVDDYLESQTKKLSGNIDQKGRDALKIDAIFTEKACKAAMQQKMSDEEKIKAAQSAYRENQNFDSLNDTDALKAHAKSVGFGERLYNGISNFAAAVSGAFVKVLAKVSSIGMFASRFFAPKQEDKKIDNRPGM